MVTLKAGLHVEPDELLAHLDRSGLSRYDMPEYYLELDSIPLTASGKILKRDVAAQLGNGSITPIPIRFRRQETAVT